MTEFVAGEKASTKAAAGLLAKVSDRRNLLVVVDRAQQQQLLSLRNICLLYTSRCV